MKWINTALMLVDLQNDFLHPQGAYGRAGITAPAINALPQRLKPIVEAIGRSVTRPKPP